MGRSLKETLIRLFTLRVLILIFMVYISAVFIHMARNLAPSVEVLNFMSINLLIFIYCVNEILSKWEQ